MRTSSMLGITLCSLVATIPMASYGNSVLWGPVEVTPSAVVLRCKWNDSVRDEHSRAGIASQPGLAGNVRAIADRIALMTRLGYQASGPAGKEVLRKHFHYSGIFEQPFKLSARVINDELHLYARAQPGGAGRIVAKDRDAVRKLLTDENRKRVTEDYQTWQTSFKNEIGRVQKKFDDYPIRLTQAEKHKLTRERGDIVKKTVRFGACNDDMHDIRLNVSWERPLGAEKKR